MRNKLISIPEDMIQESLEYAIKSRKFTSNRHDFHEGGLDAKQRKMFEGKLGEKIFKKYLLNNNILFKEDTSSHMEADIYDFIMPDNTTIDVKTRTQIFHTRTLEMVEQFNKNPKTLYISIQLFPNKYEGFIIGWCPREYMQKINRIENNGYLDNYVMLDNELRPIEDLLNIFISNGFQKMNELDNSDWFLFSSRRDPTIQYHWKRRRNIMNKKNLWILTEERPKNEVIGAILNKFAQDNNIACFFDQTRILPMINEDRTFTFTYEVKGVHSKVIDNIYIKTVSGYSSFVDFLVFFQDHEPTIDDTPIYAIEETKTDDAESRNTGVYQRASKFVYIEYYYPNIKKIMLYSLQIEQKEIATDTNVFGTRCLITLGVEILGKEIDYSVMKPFTSVDEVIEAKNAMRQPPAGNVPVRLEKFTNKITVSGRLIKADSLSHDPSIGTLSLICATLRVLGWDKELEITSHGLDQSHVVGRRINNKFLKIAYRFNIGLYGLTLTKPTESNDYWRYDLKGEKLGTIFVHLVVENFTKGFSIYENHAGCERGYFMTKEGDPIVVGKFFDKDKYKAGDKSQIIYIPDLVLVDIDRTEIINVEGKKDTTMEQGIKELDNFDGFEDNYIRKYFPEYKTIIRTVVLYGGNKESIDRIEVSFLLNSKGKMVLSCKAPRLFTEAIKNLLDYWRV